VCRRVYIEQTLYTKVCKWEKDTCYKYSKNGVDGDRHGGGVYVIEA
jgi:hypothetical protein